LRSIGVNLDRAAVVAHPYFYDPLFVIGRPLVFDFLALFRRFSFPSRTDQWSTTADKAAGHNRFLHS